MTTAELKALLNKMQADTAQGTPGPWDAKPKGIHPYPYVVGAEREYEFGRDRPVTCYLVGMDTETNARRIARLPDLETACVTLATDLLAAQAEIEIMQGDPGHAYFKGMAAGQKILRELGQLTVVDSPELAGLRAEIERLRGIGRAILEADAGGQGLPFAEAMDTLRAAIIAAEKERGE